MNADIDSKLLPQRPDAERHVLGCCMKFDGALNIAVEACTVDGDFFKRLHRQLYRVLIEIDGDPELKLDLFSITDAMQRSAEGLSDADYEYILKLYDDVVTTAGFDSSLELVKDASTLRNVINQARQIISRAVEHKDKPREIVEDAEDRFFQIAQGRVSQDVHSLRDLIGDALEDIRAIHEKRAVKDAISTGYFELDELLTGLHRANLIILASRPGMGKTALGLNIAQRAALEQELGVAFFSLEMSAEELVRRMLCAEARVDSHQVRSGHIGEHDMESFVRVAARLANAPFYIDDTAALTVMELRAKARRLVMQRDVQLIVVDYLQLMTAPHRKPESRQVEVAEISRSLKQLAMELKVPVLAMAQLNRGVTSRTVKSKIPQLSDLRESGAIEQDADVVLFLHRDDYYKVGKEDHLAAGEEAEGPVGFGNQLAQMKGVSQVIVAKQRNGPVGNVYLVFRNKYLRFENLDPSFKPRPAGVGADDGGEVEDPF